MGLLTGITESINEILDGTVNKLPTFGAPQQQYQPLPNDLMEINDLHPNWNYYPGGVGNPLPKADEIALENSTNPAKEELWDGIIKESTARVNTVLEERSYMDFYFQNTLIGRRRVVFFENPKITEQRAPKYASKQIVGRNEPVRLWTGADARKVRVNFTYTLPHVEHFFKLMGSLPAGFSDQAVTNTAPTDMKGVGDTPEWANVNAYRKFTAETVAKLFGVNFNANATEGASVGITNNSLNGPRLYKEDKSTLTPVEGFEMNAGGTGEFIRMLVNCWSINPTALTNVDMVATFYTQFVIDTLRASVIGDTLKNNTVVGPPIVRFRHGTVFNEAPFIVRSFNVEYDTKAGYEVRTLTPRQVNFSIELEEFRQTHGSHHTTTQEQVPSAGQVLELSLRSGRQYANAEKINYPTHKN